MQRIATFALILLVTAALFSIPFQLRTFAQGDFTVASSPSSLDVVMPGADGTSFILLTGTGGFTGQVSLTATVSPSGPYVYVGPPTVNIPVPSIDTPTLTFSPLSGTVPGIYNVTVTAMSGLLTHSVFVIVTVTAGPDFTLTVNHSSLTVERNSTAGCTLELTSVNGFSGPVVLGLEGPVPILLDGPVVTLDPAEVYVPLGGQAFSAMTIAAKTDTPLGVYAVNVDTTGNPHYVMVTITVASTIVPDFSISPSVPRVVLAPGSNGSSTILIRSLNNFTGNLRISTQGDSELTISLSPDSLGLSAGQVIASVLQLSAATSALTGNYTITVSVSSGTITHSLVISLVVTRASWFDMAVDPAYLNIGSQGRGASNFLVKSLNTFSGLVDFELIEAANGPAVTQIPSAVSLTAGTTATFALLVSRTPTTQIGTYVIQVVASPIDVAGPGVSVQLVVDVTNEGLFLTFPHPPRQTIATSQGSTVSTEIPLLGTTTWAPHNVSFAAFGYLASSMTPTRIIIDPTNRPPETSFDFQVFSSLTVTTSLSTPAGMYTIDVVAWSDLGLSSWEEINVWVTPFSISLNNLPLTIRAGSSSANSTLTVTSVNGFSGRVDFTLSGSDLEKINAKLTPTYVIVQQGNSNSTTLTVSIPASTATGLSTVGLSFNLTASTTLASGLVVYYPYQVGVSLESPPICQCPLPTPLFGIVIGGIVITGVSAYILIRRRSRERMGKGVTVSNDYVDGKSPGHKHL